jgi:trehalose 6-phosphate phosphatase
VIAHNIRSLPSALNNPKLEQRLSSSNVALFLDYDGTLTRIVKEPSKALLSDETRRVLGILSKLCPVAILSGRDVLDVRKLVGVKGIVYAGSHGFEIIERNGSTMKKGFAKKGWLSYIPPINRAESDFRNALKSISGVRLERKRFAIAVHYRQVKDSDVNLVARIFSKVASSYPELRKTKGKKVFEVLPRVKWNKGIALRFMLRNARTEREHILPIFIGDDLTDEDAFKAIRKKGVGILVIDKETSRETLACYKLTGPKEVRLFLSSLADKIKGQ